MVVFGGAVESVVDLGEGVGLAHLGDLVDVHGLVPVFAARERGAAEHVGLGHALPQLEVARLTAQLGLLHGRHTRVLVLPHLLTPDLGARRNHNLVLLTVVGHTRCPRTPQIVPAIRALFTTSRHLNVHLIQQSHISLSTCFDICQTFIVVNNRDDHVLVGRLYNLLNQLFIFLIVRIIGIRLKIFLADKVL